MNERHLPKSAPADLVAELQHLAEANETTRTVLRETFASLLSSVELHLDQVDAEIHRMMARIHRS